MASLEVARRGGRDVVVDVRSEPPVAIRRTGDRVLVAGSAAAPVGGDELMLDVVVGPGARLRLGTVAATLAWPGVDGRCSRQTVRATVGAGGHLTWEPESLVAVRGCRHAAVTQVALAPGATASIVEEIVLGRRGEESGRLDLTWRIERDGRPLVHHAEQLGPDTPGWGAAVTAGSYRHLIAVVSIGLPLDGRRLTTVDHDASAARLDVAPDVNVVLGAGVDRPAAHRGVRSVLRMSPHRATSEGQYG